MYISKRKGLGMAAMDNHRMINFILMVIILAAIPVNAQINVNESLPAIVLRGENGGNLDGTEWRSSDLEKKLNIVFYVAPNQQDNVEPLLNKVDSAGYSQDFVKVTLIINTEATWIPTGIIEGKIRSKANDDSTKNYVLDNDKILLREWNLSEDNPNIIVIDKDGKVINYFNDELNYDFGNDLLKIIESKIKEEKL